MGATGTGVAPAGVTVFPVPTGDPEDPWRVVVGVGTGFAEGEVLLALLEWPG